MHKGIVTAATILILTSILPNVLAVDSKPPLSRQDLEKIIQDKDAEIKKLKDEISSLRTGQGTGGTSKAVTVDAKSKSSKGDGTRKNPANIGDVITIDVDRLFYGKCSVEIELLEVVRGLKALRMIKAGNQYNSNPPAGKEYVMARFRVKNLKDLTGKDGAFDLTKGFFDYADSDGKIIDAQASVAGVTPSIDAKLFEGSQNIGWTFFLVTMEEKSPKVVFVYESDTYLWFSLTPTNIQTKDTDQTGKSDKGNVTTLKHGDQEFRAKVLGKPVFGIRLGENINDIKKRYKVQFVEDPWAQDHKEGKTPEDRRMLDWYKRDQTWKVASQNKDATDIEINTFEGIVYIVSVKLDSANGGAIRRQVADAYQPYIKNEGEIDSGYMFELEMDGERVLYKIFTDSGCHLLYQYWNLFEYKSHVYENSTLKAGVKESL
jgi:hypothetical protein